MPQTDNSHPYRLAIYDLGTATCGCAEIIIRALHHSKVFIQNITGNSHYAMNESKRKFLNYLIISSFST